MRLFERELTLTAPDCRAGMLNGIRQAAASQIDSGQTPIRFVVASSSERSYRCEVCILEGAAPIDASIFDLHPRGGHDPAEFTAVLVIPTGIGAEIGGHAGDATPVARLLASVCDTLITHPNVVNASDLNELPANGLYVEGSIISRFLMGSISLQRVRSNRVLVIIDAHPNERFTRATVNAVNGARATYGLPCERIVVLDPPLPTRGRYASSGRAAGAIDELERVFDALDRRRGEYDAVAISTVIDIDVPHASYFASRGEIVNPWGGVEAMLTHAVSTIYDVPSAHAPMMESEEIANMDPGVIDPRMAAEVVSLTFFQSVLKGLHKAPRISKRARPNSLTAHVVSCLVIPDGCLGLPTLAALEQNIPVIAVRENRSLMHNDLTMLPWAAGQLHVVENYWEATGLMAAMKEGMDPTSVRRPLASVKIERATQEPAAPWSSFHPSKAE